MYVLCYVLCYGMCVSLCFVSMYVFVFVICPSDLIIFFFGGVCYSSKVSANGHDARIAAVSGLYSPVRHTSPSVVRTYFNIALVSFQRPSAAKTCAGMFCLDLSVAHPARMPCGRIRWINGADSGIAARVTSRSQFI